MRTVRFMVPLVAGLVTATAAMAADYPPAPYRSAYRAAPAPVTYYAPRPIGIPQAPPVIWVEAPPQYVQHLVPTGACGGCGPQYRAVGEWRRTPPPAFWDSIYRDYGY
ncbi:hypothetical protein RPB_1031 [Rhodopseudomonas palustris HaA2]|uniref:Uncharacterized protein n=1 Tax=Rhodopseudomonas palustris (strain HaA2) TaxID=316058 RepID=Q2J1B9_RHOP2|nr:hypothetical protein RPB_1031 [Rhodopseudomonas palustris HaA2]